MTSNEKSIILLTALSHAMVHTFELSIPIFITIWIESFSVNKFIIGSVATIGYGLFGLGSIPSGIFSDRIGSRAMLIWALGGMSLAFVILSFSVGLYTITLGLILWGVAASIHHPASLSLISKHVDKRGEGFAYHGMAGNTGIAVGPFVATVLLMFLSWRIVAFLLALPGLAATVVGLQLSVEENNGERQDEKQDLSAINSFSDFFDRSYSLILSAYGLILIVVMCEGLYYRGILTFLPELFSNMQQIPNFTLGFLSLETSRYIYSGMLMFGILGQYIGGRLSDIVNPRRGATVLLCLLTLLAGLYIFVNSYSLPVIILLSLTLGITLFMIQPLYQSMIADYTPEGYRGLAYGYSFFGIFGVGALGASLAGNLITFFTPAVLFAVLAGILLVAVFVLLYMEVFIGDSTWDAD
ncbi:MAG: MFS transporter [bacterium]